MDVIAYAGASGYKVYLGAIATITLNDVLEINENL